MSAGKTFPLNEMSRYMRSFKSMHTSNFWFKYNVSISYKKNGAKGKNICTVKNESKDFEKMLGAFFVKNAENMLVM